VTTGAEAATDGFTHRQILTVMSGLILGMFLASLDRTIVSTSIRSIGDDLHGLSAQAWVTTSFLITTTLTTPLYGRLSDIVGRKRVFLVAIAIFIFGSALCGLSTSMHMLAAFRALQGLGAGGLLPVAIAIVADIVSPLQRPRYMGYVYAAFGFSSVLGPVVGGLLSGQQSILGITGWRWIFYVNVPIGLVALIVVNRVLQLPVERRSVRLDWLGAAVMALGLIPLLLIAEQGHEWGWVSPRALYCYACGVFGVVAFGWVERRMGDAALLPLRMFRIRPFAIGSAQSAVVGVGMFGGMAAIPLYLQVVKGATPVQAGLLMLPMVAAATATALTIGRLTVRNGKYRRYPIFGSIAMITALLGLATLGANTPIWHADIFMALFGIGIGSSMQSIQLAMQNSSPPRDIGVASSTSLFFRQLGGTLGTSVFLSILFSGAPHRISTAYDHAHSSTAFAQAAAAHPGQLAQVSQAAGSINDTSFLQSIDPVLAHPLLIGFSQALEVVFVFGAIAALPNLVLALMAREVPLRRVSGIEARTEVRPRRPLRITPADRLDECSANRR
jgi:EmrB/QacA subfamily drug resistance transporter